MTIATEAEIALPKHRDSYLVRPDSRDQELPFPDFPDIDGDGATFQTNMKMARLSKKVFQGFLDRGGDGMTFATMVDTARLRKRRDSKSNGATGLASATKKYIRSKSVWN